MGVERTEDTLLTSNTGSVIPYSAYQTVNFPISAGSDVYEHWDFMLQLQAVVAGYTSAPTLYLDGPENLLGLVQLNAAQAQPGGVNEVFKSYDGPYMRFTTLISEGGVDVLRTTITGSTNGTYGISTTPRMYFGDPLAVDANGNSTSWKSWLDSRLLTSLTLSILWRGGEAIGYGGTGGTITIGNAGALPALTVKARCIVGVDNLDGAGRVIARQYLREVKQDFPIANAGVFQLYQNMRYGNILRRLVFRITAGPQPWGERSDVPFGSSTLQAEGPHFQVLANTARGPKYLLDTTYLQQQNANRREYKGVSAWPAGYIVWDADPKRHSETKDQNLTGVSNLQFKADTVVVAGATNNAQVTYTEVAQTT